MKSPLEKKGYFFYRDEEGKLLPESVKLDNGEEAYLIPLARGEVRKLSLFTGEEIEEYILSRNVRVPELTKEDLKFIKPEYSKLLIDAVYNISGLDIKKSLKETEDEFAENLRKISAARKEGDLLLFLHKQGYNFFNSGKLTYTELNTLIEAYNRAEDEKSKAMKKANKGKRR